MIGAHGKRARKVLTGGNVRRQRLQRSRLANLDLHSSRLLRCTSRVAIGIASLFTLPCARGPAMDEDGCRCPALAVLEYRELKVSEAFDEALVQGVVHQRQKL